MRLLLLLITSMVFVWAAPVLSPVHQITVKGLAKDMVFSENSLVIATDAGHIEVYDAKNYQKIKEIKIPDVKDFMGDTMPARVLSTDRIGDTYLLLSDSGKGGYSNLFIEDNGTLSQIISPDNKEAVIKARFVDKTHILLGYLGNEAALLDLKTKKERYHVQLSESKFSDFALNEKKTEAVFACESGVLSVIDVQTGKVVQTLQGQNLDNVYKVDFKNGMVSAAGKDRRGALYDVQSGKGSYIKGKFFIYATALSPSASKVAFAMDEDNTISIFNTGTQSKTALLKGQKSTLNVIIFKDEHTLYSASDDSTVMVWDLNQK
jgi:WD40 repeat protein